MNDVNNGEKELLRFLIITYGGSFLIGIPFNYDCRYLPYFQSIIMMFFPAAGVIIPRMRKVGRGNYRKFYLSYLVGMFGVLLCLAGYLLGEFSQERALIMVNLLIGVISITSIIIMKKEMRIVAGIKKVNTIFWVFIIVETAISLVGTIGDANDYVQVLIYLLPKLFINVMLSISLCFGEELGWRGFLQKKMQKRYGLKKGVVLLGILWEVWHIPLWFTQYRLSFYEIGLRFLLTISLSIFLGYVYMKTDNVWVCAVFHLLINIFSGGFEGQLVYKKVIYGMSLNEVLQIIFVLSLFLFVFSDEYKQNEKISDHN